jgi:hypothetical protein
MASNNPESAVLVVVASRKTSVSLLALTVDCKMINRMLAIRAGKHRLFDRESMPST